MSQNESHYDIPIHSLAEMFAPFQVFFSFLFFNSMRCQSVRCCARFVSVYGHTRVFVCASEAGGSTGLGLGI